MPLCWWDNCKPWCTWVFCDKVPNRYLKMEKQFSLVLDIIECQNTLILLLSLKQSNVRKWEKIWLWCLKFACHRKENKSNLGNAMFQNRIFVPYYYVFCSRLDLGFFKKPAQLHFTLRESSLFLLLFLCFFFVYVWNCILHNMTHKLHTDAKIVCLTEWNYFNLQFYYLLKSISI